MGLFVNVSKAKFNNVKDVLNKNGFEIKEDYYKGVLIIHKCDWNIYSGILNPQFRVTTGKTKEEV